MDIQTAWTYGRSQLSSLSPHPALDARLLLQHVLGVSHSFLIAHHTDSLTPAQEKRYLSLLTRAAHKEPIPYLIGHAPFYGFDFRVNTAVLIPRPETEQLVEHAIAWANARPPVHIVDVGTGSGCIAISLAHHLPQTTIEAVDISADALAVAQANAQQYVPHRIHFYQGDLLTPISSSPDLIVANLPYVTNAEWTMLDDGVKLHEPSIALKGGVDGFDLITRLLSQAVTKINSNGAIFLEIGWQQGAQAQQIVHTCWPQAQVEIIADYAGHDRIVAAMMA